jgi:undecaprenyl-diphosphatase
MTLLQAIILGVVEGFTEFLPISSTGHLILASRLLGLAQTDFQKSFEISIQLGAILSVIVLYWRKFLDIQVLTRVITAFIPTGIIGFALYKVVKTYLLDSETIVLWSLFLGGITLIVFELFHQEKDDAVAHVEAIPYSKCAAIGLFQSIAMIPGVSRSGATIIGGLILNLSRSTIVGRHALRSLQERSHLCAAGIRRTRRRFHHLVRVRAASRQMAARLCTHQYLHSLRHLPHLGGGRLLASVGRAKTRA